MSIFSFAEEVVDSAIGIISNAMSQVADLQQTIVSDFDPIVNGAWIGKGSTEFQNEVTSDVLPAIQDLSQLAQSGLNMAKTVEDQIKQADSFLDNLFGVVEDVFDAITPW